MKIQNWLEDIEMCNPVKCGKLSGTWYVGFLAVLIGLSILAFIACLTATIVIYSNGGESFIWIGCIVSAFVGAICTWILVIWKTGSCN